MPQLMSFAATWPQIMDQSKTVTRRCRLIGGEWVPAWRRLAPGDLVVPTEWTQRVVVRWCCLSCAYVERRSAMPHWSQCPECGHQLERRGPARAPAVRTEDARVEALGDITADEVAAEGFPGRSPEWFLEMFTGIADIDRPEVRERPVNRIEFSYPATDRS